MSAYDRAVEAIKAAGDAYVAWRVRRSFCTEESAEKTRQYWQKHLLELVPSDWYLAWPRDEQQAFVHDLGEVQKRFERDPSDSHTALTPLGVTTSSPTLSSLLLSYNGLEHYVLRISRLVGPWFGEAILAYVDEPHFYARPASEREKVCDELVRVYFDLLDGELTAEQSGPESQSHNRLRAIFMMLTVVKAERGRAGLDHFAALGAYHRKYGTGESARSLAHASAGRVELSPRQQAVYQRRLAGF